MLDNSWQFSDAVTMKTKPVWAASDLTNAKSFNGRGIEFQSLKDDEFHFFEVLYTPEKIVFGGCCNCGFLESGYILRDETESLDETLQELLSDLETYYNDGPEYVSRIVCNERM